MAGVSSQKGFIASRDSKLGKAGSNFFRKWTAPNLIRESVGRKPFWLSEGHHIQFVTNPSTGFRRLGRLKQKIRHPNSVPSEFASNGAAASSGVGSQRVAKQRRPNN